jgi:cysteine desulfurase
VLYVRSPLKLVPILLGGSQENELRAGTENLAGIAGLVSAWEQFGVQPVMPRSRLQPLCARLEQYCLAVEGVRRWGPELPTRLANTLALTAEGCDSLSLLAGLDLGGICASSGSACAVGSLKPSHVLSSLGASQGEASGLVRFSLGAATTAGDVTVAGRVFAEVVSRVRNSSDSRSGA